MKGKKSIKAQKKPFFDSKEKIIGFSVAGAVVLILIIVLMLLETGDSKLVVKNNTDLKLDYVKTIYVNEEENTDLTDPVKTGSIDANKTYSKALKPVDLLNRKATCNISFKFEKHDEMYIDSGYFNENFKGTMKIAFTKTDDPNKLKMTVKAGNGLLPAKMTKCNDVFTVELNTGKVYDE